MKSHLTTYCQLGAALVLAAAGILGMVDTMTMIILVVVLTSSIRNRCLPLRRA
jgi:hypothetical protein